MLRQPYDNGASTDKTDNGDDDNIIPEILRTNLQFCELFIMFRSTANRVTDTYQEMRYRLQEKTPIPKHMDISQSLLTKTQSRRGIYHIKVSS